MKIILPDNFIQLVKQATLPDRRYALRGGVVNALLAVPEFARHPEIYPLLIEKILYDKRWLEDRNFASMILHDIGDSRGILHLTYNCLTTHPILKIRQDDLHGWHSGWLLKRADSLTEECINLLIGDLKSPNGYLHMDVLSTVPTDKIVPRMLPLLEAAEKAAMAAAYVLAIKGRDEGRSILERLAETQKYVEFALIALSHIPDDKTLHYLRTYADPQHAIYERHKNSFISTLLRHAEARLFLLQCHDPHPVRRTMEHFYLRPIQELMAKARKTTLRDLNDPKYKNDSVRPLWEEAARWWIYPPPDFNRSFFLVNSHLYAGALGTGVSAPDFLWEFATPEDRAYCMEIQRESIRALLSLETIEWARVGNGYDMGVEPKFLWGLSPSGRERDLKNYYVPGFEITYEPEDYERAATEWIIEPQKYRFAHRLLVDYEPGSRRGSH